MLIGEDFDKIEFTMWGLNLLEPNAFIGDSLILVAGLIFAFKTWKLGRTEVFFQYWKAFFLVFGIGMFFGGLAHLFYNYWGFWGKYPPWHVGIVAVMLLEKAMISIHPNAKIKTLLNKLSNIKFVLAFIAGIAVYMFADLSKDISIGVRVPAINSAIGLIFCLGILGYKYTKVYNRSFRYMCYSVLVMLPSGLCLALKINIHPWFDKNDLAHLFLILGMAFYYQGIKGYAKQLDREQSP